MSEEFKDFTVEQAPEVEDSELLDILEKEQVLTDLGAIIEDEPKYNYCVSCFYNPDNGGKCPILSAVNGTIQIHNGRYKANPQIERFEKRWGCTSHRESEVDNTDQV